MIMQPFCDYGVVIYQCALLRSGCNRLTGYWALKNPSPLAEIWSVFPTALSCENSLQMHQANFT